MKKLTLRVLTLVLSGLGAAALTTTAASAQTISLGGTSGTINAGAGFASSIRLTISGANAIGDIESVNVLLATPSSGVNAGGSFFTITSVVPAGQFTTTNSGAGTMSFTLAGDAANAGRMVSSPGDAGSNAPAGSNPVAATGTTNITVETLTLSSAANTPRGTYNFFFTSGGVNDAQGSYVANMANGNFDINSTPTFTVTIVPEPTTWALLALGATVLLGTRQLRRHRA